MKTTYYASYTVGMLVGSVCLFLANAAWCQTALPTSTPEPTPVVYYSPEGYYEHFDWPKDQTINGWRSSDGNASIASDGTTLGIIRLKENINTTYGDAKSPNFKDMDLVEYNTLEIKVTYFSPETSLDVQIQDAMSDKNQYLLFSKLHKARTYTKRLDAGPVYPEFVIKLWINGQPGKSEVVVDSIRIYNGAAPASRSKPGPQTKQYAMPLSKTPDSVLKVGVDKQVVSDFDDAHSNLENMEVLLKQLAVAINIKIEQQLFSTQEELEYAFNQGDIDSVITYSDKFDERASQGVVSPLVTAVTDGKVSQAFHLFVRSDSPLTELGQVRGKNLGLKNDEAWVYLREIIGTMGGNSSSPCFKKINYYNTADDTIVSLRMKDVDVIGGFDYFQTINKRMQYPVMRSLSKTRRIPNAKVYYSNALSAPKLRQLEKIKELLLQYHQDPEGQKIMRYYHIDKFMDCPGN